MRIISKRVLIPTAGIGLAFSLWYLLSKIRVSPPSSSETEEDNLDNVVPENERNTTLGETTSCEHSDHKKDNGENLSPLLNTKPKYIPPIVESSSQDNDENMPLQFLHTEATTSSDNITNYDHNKDNLSDVSTIESKHDTPFVQDSSHEHMNHIKLTPEISDTSMNYMRQLPEECLNNVIALTTPSDALRLSVLSRSFRSAADSEAVWGNFLQLADLPALDILNNAWESKKQLYLYLCDNHVLFDGGTMSLRLDRWSGAKIYTLSARALIIGWSHYSNYWQWVHHQDSRFLEVAKLLQVCWFDITGKIDSKQLSYKMNYAAYIIFRTTDDSNGLDDLQEAKLYVGNNESTHIVCLKPSTNRRYRDVTFPRVRVDGWMELKLGEFYNENGEDGEVVMNLSEIKRLGWKSGLFVQGIEIRPEPPALSQS